MEFLNLFEITIEVSFLILFIGIVRKLLKNFINPNFRYFLWVFVAIRILMPLHMNISVAVPQMPEDSTLYLGMEVNLENTPLGAMLLRPYKLAQNRAAVESVMTVQSCKNCFLLPSQYFFEIKRSVFIKGLFSLCDSTYIAILPLAFTNTRTNSL